MNLYLVTYNTAGKPAAKDTGAEKALSSLRSKARTQGLIVLTVTESNQKGGIFIADPRPMKEVASELFPEGVTPSDLRLWLVSDSSFPPE